MIALLCAAHAHQYKDHAFQARGISVEEFLRKQEEIIERFDSGFDGYRGLNGESVEHAKRNMSAHNPRQFPDAYNIPSYELHKGRCNEMW